MGVFASARVLVGACALVAASLTVPLSTSTAPVVAAGLPEPARADVLPAPQVNGVVWKFALAGNTAFAGGEFSEARPFGVAAGGPGAISSSNPDPAVKLDLIAFDVTTGVLDSSFVPEFNAPINDMTVTPDGKKLVVVGTFTVVNGQPRNRVAVFDLPSLTLDTQVVPNVNAAVYGVAASNTAIYLGGVFNSVNGTPRPRLASISATNGSLNSLNIPIPNNRVNAVVVSPDGKQIAFGGSFTSVGGSSNPGYGIYRANATTGARLPLPANAVVRNAGPNAAITSMAADSTSFYGAGYNFHGTATGEGNTEGVFQASWSTGGLVTLDDCHGDSYGVAPAGDVVYVASHHHNCLNSGGFPQTEPSWTLWHAAAWSKSPQGTNVADTYNYPDHPGTPRGALLPFFPQFTVGSATGQSQATWTVAANSQYVLFGGEFPKVDGISQQGIARFGVRGTGPNKVGPIVQSRVGPFFQSGAPGGTFPAYATSLAPGQVRLSWPALWDRDDLTLTYEIFRDGQSLSTPSAANYQWSGKQLRFTDTGLPGGSTPSYVVKATDPDGNTLSSAAASTTVAGTDPLDPYTAAVIGDGASKLWQLDESGSTVADLAGPDYTTAGSGVTRGASSAMVNSTDAASSFDGSDNGVIISSNLTPAPNTFSEEVWFRTTSTTGGKIAGFGDAASGSSSHHDRHLYLDASGVLHFGVAPAGVRRDVSSGRPVNDGAWHQVVGTLGPGGMALYLDGKRVGWNDTVKSGLPYGGRWRLGGDTSWSGARGFTGDLDDFSVYPSALTPAQVTAHWVASGRAAPPATPPTATFSTKANGRHLDLSWVGADSDGYPITRVAWSFGDGKSATGARAGHTYLRNGTYRITLSVTDNRNVTGTASRLVSVVNGRPSAVIGASVRKHRLVVLSAGRSADPDGRIVSYAWRFGDHKTAKGRTVRHKFKKVRTYAVTLVVTDNSGAKRSAVLRVRPRK